MWLAWLFTTALASGWSDLPERAARAWEAGPGQAQAARIEGAERAARVGSATEVGLHAEAQLGAVGQDQVLASVALPLVGPGGGARAWRAEAQRREAEQTLSRRDWTDQVIALMAALTEAATLREHFAERLETGEATLARYRKAADDGLVSQLAAEDLAAELAGFHREAASWAAREAALRARLEAMLGEPVEALAVPDETSGDNPWTPLLTHVSPEASLAGAAAEAAELEARAIGRGTAPVLDIGATAIREFDDYWVPLAFAGITVPLAHPARGERRERLAEATALSRQQDWEQQRFEGEVNALSAQWEEEHAWALHIEADLVAPLRRRAERLESAFTEGLVAADHLVRARNEHHEAEHAQLELRLSLVVHEARAAAWALESR